MGNYKPEGHGSVSPYLLVRNVAAQLEFLAAAFDAQHVFRMEASDGSIKHAEVRIDDSVVMLGERAEAAPNSTHVYVPDVDATYRAALEAGAASVSEPRNQPYGDRSAGVRDPAGNVWWLGTKLG